MKVRKVGVLSEGHRYVGAGFSGHLMAKVTNLPDLSGPTVDLKLMIGKGATRRELLLTVPFGRVLDLQISEPTSHPEAEPFVATDDGYEALFVYQNQFFVASTQYVDSSSVDEAVLMIKRSVLSDNHRLKRLRQEVETLERIDTQGGFERTAIPDAVRLAVWARDGGKCVQCGASEKLHFDHVIPVTKGGGSSELNLQILCETCNLKKSDKIGF